MTDDIERTVAEFIRLCEILAGTGRILAAVSGGADSIALLYILKALRDEGLVRADIVCGHVNHGLRGQAADADERFVAEQARGLELPVVTKVVDVRAYAGMHKLSVETAGRQLRLVTLGEIARERGCSWIATGHQKNDNAETVIHRLGRGTGFRGLAGIRPTRRLDQGLWLARPLLCLTRDEIVRYLREHHLRWREDHTNTDTTYTRNHIRHKLLPLLQQESHASIVEELAELAGSAGRLYDRVRLEAEKAWAKMVQADVNTARIDATGLALLHELIAIELTRQALVSLGCGERDLSQRHYKSILRLARRREAEKRISLPGGFSARYESGRIVLSPRPCSEIHLHRPPTVVKIPGMTRFGDHEIKAQVLGRDEVDLPKIAGDKSRFVEYLDWDRVKPPVVVRPRRAGDRFEPLGLDAMKRVGKFLTAARVPRDIRQQTAVFADQEKIVWVCPVRIAESVKVTEGTRRVLALTVRSIRPT